VFAEEIAVVSDENDNCAFRAPVGLQCVHDCADAAVHPADEAIVILGIDLIFLRSIETPRPALPAFIRLIAKKRRQFHPIIVICRFWDRHNIVDVQFFFLGHGQILLCIVVFGVRNGVRNLQEKWFVFRARLQKTQRFVRVLLQTVNAMT